MRIVIAVSAGNEAAPPAGATGAKGTTPASPASLAGDPALLGRLVAVGSVDPAGKISSFSNRAGANARNDYLLAPGEDIVTAGLGNKYYAVSGTSFASPHVAGALALMLQLFPNISATQAMQALLMTADDYVDPAVDPVAGVAAGVGADNVSGVGVLNLQRAFAPIGQTALSIGKVLPTPQIPQVAKNSGIQVNRTNLTTTESRPYFTGTYVPGTNIQIVNAQGEVVGQAPTNNLGQYRVRVSTPLSPATYPLYARVEDQGHYSELSHVFDVKVIPPRKR